MRLRLAILLIIPAAFIAAQTVPNPAPVEHWKSEVLKGDAVALKSLYSSSPAAVVNTISGKSDANAGVAFWTGLKPKTMSVTVVESGSPRPGVQMFTLQATVKGADGRITHVVEAQAWQDQGGVWRLVREKPDVAKLEQPLSLSDKIYPTGDARQEIQQAQERAARGHKNILLIFGADWCYDCHVLDKAFHRQDIAAILKPNYEVVHVDTGDDEQPKNRDVAAQYAVPLDRGIPAIAVLDSSGQLLYSQKNGEWERARALGPEDLLGLLNKWKPQAR